MHVAESPGNLLELILALFQTLGSSVDLAAPIHETQLHAPVGCGLPGELRVCPAQHEVGFVHLSAQLLEVFEILCPVLFECGVGSLCVAVSVKVRATVKDWPLRKHLRVHIGEEVDARMATELVWWQGLRRR